MKKILSLIAIAGCLSLQAQSDGLTPVDQQFANFSKRNIQEKIFVHTDKEFYLAGEIVWYKLYYLDGSTHKQIDLSKLAYVEIVDQNNKPVMQAKNALHNSSGKGSFYLPSSVNSGNFKLRAYTSWMKNFDAGYFFEKNLTIINSFKPLNLPLATPEKKFDAGFFVEGGTFVANLDNRIAFKITDQYGKGLEAKGMVTDDKNDTVARFATQKFGMGNFSFKPASGRVYRAFIEIEGGKSFTAELPILNPSGFALRVDEESAGKITVTIQSASYPNEEVFLLAHTRQITKFTEKKVLVNGATVFTFDKSVLGDGVSQITIFNRDQRPVAERIVFKAPARKLAFETSLGSTGYKTRDKVGLDVTSKFDGAASKTNMSLSVYQVDSLSPVSMLNMEDYLLLSSDLRGDIESPEYYFSADPDVKQVTENLMMTQGWRRFTWNQPLRKTALAYDYPPEFDGHIIGTTVTYLNKQQPASDIKAFASVPGTKTQYFASMTDINGKAFFDVRDYYGRNEMVIQAESVIDSNFRIDVIDPFSEKYSARALPFFDMSTSRKSLIVNHSLAMQTLNAYLGDSLTRFDVPKIDTMPFFGKATKRYLLDDYVRFTTMEEVLREYVPEIGLKRTNGQLKLRITDWDMTKYLEGEPLILFDGVPVTHKQILAYDPMKVRKLEVVTNRFINGKFVYDGIASFTSYGGNLPEFVYDPKTVLVDYEGLQLEREYYSPVYETDSQKMSRVADFRDVLTWQPDIKTDANGKASINFYTSDRKGKYVGVLHGIDANGNAGTQTFTFEVTK